MGLSQGEDGTDQACWDCEHVLIEWPPLIVATCQQGQYLSVQARPEKGCVFWIARPAPTTNHRQRKEMAMRKMRCPLCARCLEHVVREPALAAELHETSAPRLTLKRDKPDQEPASLEDCRRCASLRNATQAAPGAGPRHAVIMLVGEQPGDQHDRQWSRTWAGRRAARFGVRPSRRRAA